MSTASVHGPMTVEKRAVCWLDVFVFAIFITAGLWSLSTADLLVNEQRRKLTPVKEAFEHRANVPFLQAGFTMAQDELKMLQSKLFDLRMEATRLAADLDLRAPNPRVRLLSQQREQRIKLKTTQTIVRAYEAEVPTKDGTSGEGSSRDVRREAFGRACLRQGDHRVQVSKQDAGACLGRHLLGDPRLVNRNSLPEAAQQIRTWQPVARVVARERADGTRLHLLWREMSAELSDTPLKRPEDDLLEVAPSAKILAGRLAAVQPPYTAGVYGEWGSGKTTFVTFVEKYLEQLTPRLPSGDPSTLFVTFSAWQYKTSDEIWRALILAIARSILGISDPASQPPASVPPPLSLWERIKSLLSADAFVLRHEQASPNAQSRYTELVTRLDASLYGGISKSAPGVDTTETTIALAKSVVAAMSGVSPMVAAIRGMFGFSTDVDFGKLVDKGQNESTRQRIESIEEFKGTLRELFSGEARRVFVFVDDLDRCMPDAALDLLEAIKIFLPSTPCVFVVAADETLIGQGLRMRFRDVVDPAGSGDVNAFMNKKGREYFEKIIQLPVHLPRPGADEVHRFIGARFPEWFAATDLIDAAIGSNPRRLKQYCNRLEYRRLISQPAGVRS